MAMSTPNRFPPLAQKKGPPLWVVIAAVIAVFVVISVALGASKDPAASDVTISSCTDGGGLNGPTATVEVTNHGSNTATYVVDVAFVSPGGATQLATGSAIVNNLAAGQNATTTATAFRKVNDSFTCKVVKVSRI